MMNSLCKLAVAGVVLGMQSTVVFASISFNVDFSNSTVGSAPVIQAASAGTTGTSVTSLALNNYVTATTVSGFPGGSGNGQVLLVTANSTAKSSSTNARADVNFKADASDAVTTGKYKISMDICYTALDNGSLNNYFYVNLRNGDGASFGGFGINFYSAAGYMNTAGLTTNPNLSSNVSKNAVHHLELLVDLDANTQTLVMDGNVTLGTSSIKDGASLQYISINTDSSAQGKLYIDNVVVNAVPETSALGLLGAGAAVSLARGKVRLGK